jgi:glycosyltransferase involved in cell wall biosynthesis
MKISLCIPQYNRIRYLLKNLSIIALQTFPDIEVVISDDASTDNTEEELKMIAATYKYPLVYYRHTVNVGYDANLRKSLELATGDYCIMMGNDDTLNAPEGIQQLVDFLEENGLPELGFCNYTEDKNPNEIMARAFCTQVIGSGEAIALKYYRSFSYVAGIIIRKDVFDQVNTNKADGSVFVQMYFAARIITGGGRFFMYNEPLVIKDIRIDGSMANSYRDTLMKKWSEFKPIDGGLKQVVWAVVEGFRDAGADVKKISYLVLKNIYRFTAPFWFIDYRSNGSFVGAAAMAKGIRPAGFQQFQLLGGIQKAKIKSYYYLALLIGFSVPVFVFKKLKPAIYKFIKK